jgi:hypothetical protein
MFSVATHTSASRLIRDDCKVIWITKANCKFIFRYHKSLSSCVLYAFLATHREIRVPRGDTRVLDSSFAFRWCISAKTGGGISGITANTWRVNRRRAAIDGLERGECYLAARKNGFSLNYKRTRSRHSSGPIAPTDYYN